MHAAKRAILKFQPGIIAITGGLGKTATRTTLTGVLAEVRSVRSTCEETSEKMRLPFATLGITEEKEGLFFWIHTIWTAFRTAYISRTYPEMLILECPEGESRRFLALTRPQITIVTAITGKSETDAVRLLGGLPSNGYAVVNGDDARCRAVALATRARTITFGFEEESDLRMTNLAYRSEKTQSAQKPAGISFAAAYGNQSAHVGMDNVFSKAGAYAAAAAMCVGTAFGLHLARTAETLRYLEMPKNRMGLSIGKKGTYVLNDSTADTEEAFMNALETVAAMPARRVIGVFGAAKKIGKEWRLEEPLNRLAVKACDAIITVGESPVSVDSKKKIRFDSAEAAAAELQAIIERDDLILITGRGLEAVIGLLGSKAPIV